MGVGRLTWRNKFWSSTVNKVICVLLGIAIAMAVATTTHASSNAGVEQAVRTYFADLPVMVKIARCESSFEHFDPKGPNGLNTNPASNSSASGVFQILLKTHGPEAARLGFDLKTIEGQLKYARHLYNKGGTRDWNSSRRCWA